jgi:hypothetical protein
MPSTRHNTALRYIQAFETLSVETFLSIQTPSCVHTFAPASINIPLPLDANAFVKHISNLKQILKGFPVTAKEILEDEAKNSVIVWAGSQAIFHDELMDAGIPREEWDYRGEYVFIFTMDGSGEKVERVVEFLDSKETERLRGLMERAKKNKESKV